MESIGYNRYLKKLNSKVIENLFLRILLIAFTIFFPYTNLCLQTIC